MKQKDRHWISVANDALFHRGPDDGGEWWSEDGRVGFAHRRLSILDLSPLGHQPMHWSGRLSIVFNGEIYNHNELRTRLESLGYIFRSRTDTEVLLCAYAEWGDQCLSRINGMFAFAIYDKEQNKIFLARDRSGEKPLFYLIKDNVLYFASELKGLLSNPALPKIIDHESLDCYLAMGYIPGERCILHGYKKLPPSHALIFNLDNGSKKLWSYWQLPEFEKTALNLSEAELVCELEYLLEDSVKKQMVADVPVGVLLSGGVDSSVITAMAVRHSKQVRTFSIGFPESTDIDETPHARLVADYFGTDHVELMADSYSAAELLPKLAHQFDEPMVDSSMFPTYLVSNLVRQHCTVALGGDGGDELFAGYHGYSRLLWMSKWLSIIPYSLRRMAANSATRFLPVGFKGRNYLMGLDVDFQHGVPMLSGLFDCSTRSLLMEKFPAYQLVSERIHQSNIPLNADIIERTTRMDFKNYLAEDILVKVDRASMINSLEIRAPLLDHRIVEFAYSRVPSHLKATTKDKKILLKKLARKLLPKEFDMRRKQGFSIPITDWLKAGPFREIFWDTLTSQECAFNPVVVKKLLIDQDRGIRNGERLFALTQFELWRKTYKVSL